MLKHDLRKILRQSRKSLSCLNAESNSYLLVMNFFKHVDLSKANCVAGYIPIDGEINVIPLMCRIKYLKYKVVVPEINHDKLIFTNWMTSEIFQGIIDIVITPLVGFDSNMNRLGMGKGFYDRMIEANNKTKFVGVTHEVQKFENIPCDTWDKKLDLIISEKNVYAK